MLDAYHFQRSRSADSFVLIRTFDDFFVDRRILEGCLVLVDKTEPTKVISCEKSGNRARVRKANLPEKVMKAIRHKAEGRKILFCGDFCHVLTKLFFAIAGVTCCSLSLDNGQDRSIDIVEAEVSEAVPGGWIVALDGHLQLHLGVVAKIPASLL
jgi:hypothetical protein